MLLVTKLSPVKILADNYGSLPSATPGTAVTPGYNSTEGAWTTLISASSVTEEVNAIYISICDGTLSGAACNQFIDIGIDPAGGTSFTPIISDLVCGMSATVTNTAGPREWLFPIRISAGSTIGCRMQDSQASANVTRVGIRLYSGGSPYWPVGSFSETIGASTGTLGTSFTPGNAVWGSWTQLGTTTQPVWWWQLGWGVNNTTVTAEYTYIDLAVGDSTNKTIVKRAFHQGTTSEIVGDVFRSHLGWHESYYPVPAGTGVYVRGMCNNAPDTGYHANAIAIGGAA